MIKNRIAFVFLLILAIIFKYNFGGFVPSFLFNTLLSLFILSIGYTMYVFTRFKFVQNVDKKVIVKGETIKLVIKLSNEDILVYPYVYVSFFNPHLLFDSDNYSQSICISPFSKKEFVFDIECKYRGKYEIGINSIFIEDFLGIIRIKYKISETKKIIVYPRIEHLSSFDIFNSNMAYSRNLSGSMYEDASNLRDLRDYSYGDSFKRIHWKLTARNSKLMVKNFHSTTDMNVNILLDLRSCGLCRESGIIIEDKLIEAAISVIHFHLSRNCAVSFNYYDEALQTINASDQNDFDFIYKTLACLEFNQCIPLADIVRLQCEISNLSTDMIIFTSILDTELYNVIYNAQMAKHNICLVYVSPKFTAEDNGKIVEDILDNLPEIGVKVYTINPDDDIKTVLGG
jgi:uncharacterized protein (DUF58 family)